MHRGYLVTLYYSAGSDNFDFRGIEVIFKTR